MTLQTDGLEPRFGVWAPVYGAWGARSHPDDPVDASYRRTRDLLVAAEQQGFDSVLLAEHIVNPQSAEAAVLETWTACAALAEATERIEIIAAVKPLLFHPGVLAKLALGIDEISGGRFAINLVSAWFQTEMGNLGIEMPPHDERYELSSEWLDVVRSLWAGGPVDHKGARFRARRARAAPAGDAAGRSDDLLRRRVRAGARAGRARGRRLLHQRSPASGHGRADRGPAPPPARRHPRCASA